jgi:hypothetical protein
MSALCRRRCLARSGVAIFVSLLAIWGVVEFKAETDSSSVGGRSVEIRARSSKGGGVGLESRTSTGREDTPPHLEGAETKSSGPDARSVLVTVTPPRDGQYLLELQRLDSRTSKWMDGHSPRKTSTWLTTVLEEKGRARVPELLPGTYRVVEVITGAVVGRFNVPNRDPDRELAIDLTSFGNAEGRVLGPADAPVANALLRVIPEASDLGFRRVAEHTCSSSSGRFRIRVRGDGPTVVQVIHPMLRLSGRRDAVSIEGAQEGITIHMERGPTATIYSNSTIEPTSSVCDFGTVAVKLFSGGVSEDPVHDLLAIVTKEGLTFGGYSPGTYTLWVDANPFAAVTQADVVLGSGHTNLGRMELGAGEEVNLFIDGNYEISRDELRVVATYRGMPSHRRVFELRELDSSSVALPGLVAGQWSLMISSRSLNRRILRNVVVTRGHEASAIARFD